MKWIVETAVLQAARARARVRKVVAGFRNDRRGVTAVEFGLVSVPFLGLLLAIFQAGLYFFTSEALEAVVQQASRNIYTGAAQGASIWSASDFLNNYFCPKAPAYRPLPSFIDCSKLVVDVRTALNFSSADLSSTFYKSGTKFCPGAPDNIVIVRVLYPMPAIVPLLGSSGKIMTGYVNDFPTASGWNQVLMGTAVFRNEPYPGTNYNPPQGSTCQNG